MTCNCDLHSLMRGEGHATACPEFGPPTQWVPGVVGETIKSTLGTFMFSGAPVEGDEIAILEPAEHPLQSLVSRFTVVQHPVLGPEEISLGPMDPFTFRQKPFVKMTTINYCPGGHEIKGDQDDCVHRCGSRYMP